MQQFTEILNFKQLSFLDNCAFEKNKIPELTLMEEASSAIFYQLKKDIKKLRNKNIAILCGSGNNGGDGLSLARKLFLNGYKISIFIVNSNKISLLNNIQKEILKTLNINLYDINLFKEKYNEYSLIIDALYGIGYSNKNNNEINEIINLINLSKAKKISIDVPSALNSCNPVYADLTYSIGYYKNEFFNISKRKYCGIIKNLKISFDIKNINEPINSFYVNKIDKKKIKINNFSNKYSKGGTIAIGGSKGKFGSIILSAKSALYSQSGISLVITDKENINYLNSVATEIIFDEYKNIYNYIDKYKSIIIGPGLNINNNEKEMISDIIQKDKQFILDASFFTNFTNDILYNFKNPPILTPHLGEAIRFFPDQADNLKNNTINSVRELSRKYNIYFLLKDSFIVYGNPEGNIYIFDKPNSILAQAGSGDIFSGILAGMINHCDNIEQAIFNSIFVFYKIALYFKKKGFKSYDYNLFIKLISKFI